MMCKMRSVFIVWHMRVCSIVYIYIYVGTVLTIELQSGLVRIWMLRFVWCRGWLVSFPWWRGCCYTGVVGVVGFLELHCYLQFYVPLYTHLQYKAIYIVIALPPSFLHCPSDVQSNAMLVDCCLVHWLPIWCKTLHCWLLTDVGSTDCPHFHSVELA